MKIIKTLLCVVLTMLPFTVLNAQLNEQLEFGRLELQALGGDAESQHSLAYRYQYGRGVEKNIDKAIEWYKKAIDNGYIHSLLFLAVLYEWADKRIDAYPLYVSYFNGMKERGIDRYWANCFITAQYKIGEYKLFGFGTPKDAKGAIQYLKDAFENGYGEPAGANLSAAYGELNDSVNSFKYMKETYEKYDGHGEQLAYYYIEGYGCEKSYAKAYEIAAPLAKSGSVHAQIELGNIYYLDDSEFQNYEQAFRWYTVASQMGESWEKGYALHQLSKMYRFGRGVKKDLSKADNLLKEASQLGYEESKSLLDLLYK